MNLFRNEVVLFNVLQIICKLYRIPSKRWRLSNRNRMGEEDVNNLVPASVIPLLLRFRPVRPSACCVEVWSYSICILRAATSKSANTRFHHGLISSTIAYIERVSVKTKHHHHFLPPTACCGSRNHRVDVTASIFLNYLNTIRVHCNPAIQEFWSLHETKHSENYFSRRPAIASWYCLPTLNSRIYQLYSHGTL